VRPARPGRRAIPTKGRDGCDGRNRSDWTKRSPRLECCVDHDPGDDRYEPKTAKVTSDSLGLKDTTQFLQSGSTEGNSDAVSHASFRHLIGLAASSVTTDLLNILNTIRGFGQNQNQPSGASTDLTRTGPSPVPAMPAPTTQSRRL